MATQKTDKIWHNGKFSTGTTVLSTHVSRGRCNTFPIAVGKRCDTSGCCHHVAKRDYGQRSSYCRIS
jgi:hypothetical protein